jgi:hypothetical protein
MRKTIFVAVLSVAVLVTLIMWWVRSGSSFDTKGSFMIPIQVVVVVLAVFFAFRRLKSAKQNLPAEDEMSKKILRRGAATSYYVSIYMWLAFMFFEERLEMERSTLIGAGIMGMAIIYALSWIYHMYIRRSHD